MGHAIQLAHEQKIRLQAYLERYPDRPPESFYTIPDELKVTIHIHGILLANHPSFTD